MRFFVAGAPVTEGSLRSVGRRRNGSAILRHDRADELDVWRSTVALAAREAGVDYLPSGPVLVDLLFALPRPKKHFGKKGLLKSAPRVPVVKPDADKLARAICDALTGIAYHDDAQVTDLVCRKRYAASPPSSMTGVFIEVRGILGRADVEVRTLEGRG